MEPWPDRVWRSKRFLRSTLALRFFPVPTLKRSKKPTRDPSGEPHTRLPVLTIVNDPRHLRPQVVPGNNAIDEAVLQKEFASLKPVRQLEPHGVPNGPLAGEADKRAGFRQRDVALEGEARRHATHRRVGQD